jgi:mRNA interferase RelE/StbE
LEHDPRPHDSIRLSGFADLYRVRVGDWRISYSVEDDKLVVLVVEISSRGSAYRDL